MKVRRPLPGGHEVGRKRSEGPAVWQNSPHLDGGLMFSALGTASQDDQEGAIQLHVRSWNSS